MTPTFLSQANADLQSAITAEISLVEAELTNQMGSQVELVRAIGNHVLSAGGKRLRPALVGLAARSVGRPYRQERAVRLGACMEMIHMATLIHDDVIDNAAERRGVPTASSVFGSTAAILSGDVLLAKAMVILAEDGDLEIIRRVSSIVVDLAEGEVQELEARGRFELSEIDHLEILRRKTATFVQACCEVGCEITQAESFIKKALGTYGYHIGMAFQIADDLLDYRASPADTGKPRATDFREGCATLPLIYLRELLSDDEAAYVCTKFGNGVQESDLDVIGEWMEARGAYARTEETAKKHVEDAIRSLDALPSSDGRDLLASVANFVIGRSA